MTKEQDKEFSGKLRPQGVFSFGVNSFPSNQWLEWDADCKEHFGDCRWIKMWNDHLVAKQQGMYSELLTKIQQLELKIASLESNKKQELGVKTMGGVIK